MKKLIQLFFNNLHILLFIFLEVVAFNMLVRYNFYHRTTYNYLANELAGNIHSVTYDWNEYIYLKEENQLLSKELVNLNAKIDKLSNLIDDNNRITNVDSNYIFINSKVVYNNVATRHNYLLLDVGSKDGVEPDMGVISGSKIVGIVNSVTKNRCRVLSLLNTDVLISAKISKNNYYGSLLWEGNDSREAILRDIPIHLKLTKGDTVVTSGFSSIFPEGIQIGAIKDFEIKDGMFFQIKVDLFTQFKSLFNVQVIKNLHKIEIDSLKNEN